MHNYNKKGKKTAGAILPADAAARVEKDIRELLELLVDPMTDADECAAGRRTVALQRSPCSAARQLTRTPSFSPRLAALLPSTTA